MSTALGGMVMRLDQKEVYYLLKELCEELGFCLPPMDNQRLMAHPPKDVPTFVQAVFLAEGLEPVEGSELYQKVEAKIAKAFRKKMKG